MFSKISHIQIIEEIAKGLEAAKMNSGYLELGIAKGSCFNKVAPHFKKATAVDTNYECFERVCKIVNKTGNAFYTGITDDYFEKANKGQKFNLIFIDACHKFENVQNDLSNSWEVLQDQGLILLHDTYPPNKEYLEHCQDAHKIHEYLDMMQFGVNAEHVTLPFFFGLTIIRKYKRHLSWQQ